MKTVRLRVGGPEVQKRHISWLNLLRPQSRLIPRVGGAFTPHSQAAAVPSLLPPLFLIPLLSEFRKILPSNALHKWRLLRNAINRDVFTVYLKGIKESIKCKPFILHAKFEANFAKGTLRCSLAGDFLPFLG